MVRVDRAAEVVREVVPMEVMAGRDVYLYSIPTFDANGEGQWERGDDIGSAKLRVRGGELLVSRLNPRKSRVFITQAQPGLAVCSSEFIVLRPTAGVEARFLRYTFLAEHIRQLLDSATQSVTRSQQRVDPEEITKLSIPALPVAEQQAIADFLDAETARIDALIGLQERLAARTAERLAAQVEHALVPDADVLDRSGAAGLPVGWEAHRLKTVLRERNDLSDDGSEELLSVSHLTGVTPRSEKNVTMTMAESLTGYKKVVPDDLVVNTLWAWMGAAGVSRYSGIVSPAYGVYRPTSDRLEPRYLDYLVRTRPFVELMTRYSKGVWTSRLRLYADELLGLRVALPPRADQQRVVARLDNFSKRAERLRDLVSRSIALLQERKQALITAAVTGQLDLAREIAEETS